MEPKSLATVIQAEKASLEDLKHDCRSKIWEYLPSSQLNELTSSLKSNQFLREISLYELNERAPLTLCQERSKRFSDRYGVFILKDRFEETAVTINHSRRKGLKHSPIFELIQSVNLLIGIDACHVVGFWADLILPLPNLTKIELSYAPQYRVADSIYRMLSTCDAVDVFAREFQPFFANLSHFGLLNWERDSDCHMREAPHVRLLLQEMPRLRSLEIPAAFLEQISTRRPGDWQPLRSLSLYSTTDRNEEPEAEFKIVAELCPELESFEYVSRTDKQSLTCKKLPGLAELLALSKLRKLSLDTGRGEPKQVLSTFKPSVPSAVPSLTEVHVTIRRHLDFGLPPVADASVSVSEYLFLFAHVASLCTLRISLEQPHFILGVLAQLERMMTHNAPPIYLRRLKIGKIRSTLWLDEREVVPEEFRATVSEVPSGKFLEKWLDVCPNLESIDASGICIDLSGYISDPRPDPESGKNGFWGIAAIVNAIRSSASIKYVKISAKLDSVAALESELPGNCGVFDVVKRPQNYGTISHCRSVPDKCWQPVSLLIIGPKENLNTFHLRILIDNN